MQITKNLITRHYWDFLHEYEVYNQAKDDEIKAQSKLQNCGAKISEVIEYAMKYHLQGKVDNGFSLPGVIKDYYLDYESIPSKTKPYYTQTIGGVQSKVEFEYLATHRDEATNNSKHNGIDLLEKDVKMFASKVRMFLQQYIDDKYKWLSVDEFLSLPNDDANSFYSICDRFSYVDCHYILIIPRFGFDANILTPFANVKWSLILNFDSASDIDGFSKTVFDNKYSRILKTSDTIDCSGLSVDSLTPICYYADGYGSYPSSADIKQWKRKYYTPLNSFITDFATSFPTQKIIVLSFLPNTELIKETKDIFERVFDGLKYVSVDISGNNHKSFCDSIGALYVNTRIDDICLCFNHYLSPSLLFEKRFFFLPYRKEEQAKQGIDEADLAKYSQYFEVLYDGIENDCPPADRLAFNMGSRIIQWSDIVNRYDARISKFDRLYTKKVKKLIEDRTPEIQIIHDPGFGGTTVSRQLAWELHEEYPVLILKKYSLEVSTLIENLYNKLKKPIVVFVEIPQVATKEQCKQLKVKINSTVPTSFIYVARKQFKKSDVNPINVEKWGIDSGLLVNHFQEDLSFCTDQVERTRRFNMLNSIMRSEAESYEQTPFYAGLITFENDFVAIDSFIKNFTDAINDNKLLKKCIVDLCIFDCYCGCPLPIHFLSVVFNHNSDTEPFELEKNINKETGIVETLLRKEIRDNSVYWTLKRTFFSKKILDKLVDNNPSLLTDYCIELIEDMSLLMDAGMSEQYIKNLFIQSNEERNGDKFVPIICDLIDINNQQMVFEKIVEIFPHNPHFNSHLARFYSEVMRRFDDALKYADAALDLDQTDPLLYHIKGTIYRNMVKDILQNGKKRELQEQQIETEIIELSDKADYCFEKTRTLADDIYEIDSYGYESPINLRVICIDGIARVLNVPKSELLTREPYIDWMDEIENLLEDMKRNIDEEDRLTIDCTNKILSLYDNTSRILQNLHNLVKRDKGIETKVNRQISHVLFKCIQEGNRDKIMESRNILEMMQYNIEQEPSEEKNYVIWFKAARMQDVSLDVALSKINAWNNVHPFIDLLFYAYTLNVAKAIEYRDSFSANIAVNLIEECKKIGRNDIKIREWLGNGENVGCIVKHSASLDKSNLRFVTGIISDYINDGNATIIIDETDLKVFFRPQRAGLSRSDLNRRVKFHLGFSYDGLRADDSSIERI